MAFIRYILLVIFLLTSSVFAQDTCKRILGESGTTKGIAGMEGTIGFDNGAIYPNNIVFFAGNITAGALNPTWEEEKISKGNMAQSSLLWKKLILQ